LSCHYSYDAVTGAGSLGIELAGTAVSSTSAFGANIQPAAADAISKKFVSNSLNQQLQWSEASFRGFFSITINPNNLTGIYYAMRNLSAFID